MKYFSWLLVLLGGCTSGSDVIIDLRTDMVAGYEFTSARVELQIDDDVGTTRTRTVSISTGRDGVAGIRLAEMSQIPDGAAQLRVTLMDGRGNGVLHRLVLLDVSGTTGVTVLMTRDCRGVTCADAAAAACLGGRCVDARCSPEAPEFCEEAAECTADLDCMAEADCSTPRCVDQLCYYSTLDARCGEGLWCNPDQGCVPTPPGVVVGDGGVDGSLDGGMDARTDSTPGDGSMDGAPTDTAFDTMRPTIDGDVPDGCVPVAETCNGMDDDCDRTIDEDADADCDVANATALCAFDGSGGCIVTGCDTGFADCDGFPESGCEADLGISEVHCGACMSACGVNEFCDTGTCAGDRVTDLAVGALHNCVVLGSGEVRCWGNDNAGEVGNGPGGSLRVETPVLAAITGVRSNQAREQGQANCMIKDTDDVWCWGLNTLGQLGNGGIASVTTPEAQPQLDVFGTLDLGAQHSCGLDRGRLWCWGEGGSGQLGNGSMSDSRTPARVDAVTGVVDFCVGQNHTCAVDGTGQAWCWGNGGSGALGNAVGGIQTSPVAVVGLMNFTGVFCGRSFTCGIRASGEINCWGGNSRGQFGNGTATPNEFTPAATATMLTGVDQIATGPNAWHSCATVGASRQVQCWGDNRYGQLGDGTTTFSNTPVDVPAMTNVAELGVGTDHVCALLDSGAVYCWGRDDSGQIGDTMAGGNRLSPVRVEGLPGAP